MQIIRRPSPFVLASSGHGTLIVNRNDYRLVGPDRGYGVGFQLLNTSYFDPEEVELVLSLLSLRRKAFGDGVIAIDCGANIGVHTIEWAKSMYGWGEVIAVEAQERLYYALAGNVAINNCFNAVVLHAAVGAKCGEISVPVPNYMLPSSFGSLELRRRENNEFIGQAIDYSANRTQVIRMLSIDSFNAQRLDFIKIDVEGMELEALEGARQSIARHKPVLLIESIKVDSAELKRTLLAAGYRIFPSGINILAVHESDPCAREIRVKAAA
jgi:FkbM family methyltransferase